MTRRTIHSFRRDPLPPDALSQALEAAVRAPNHKLTSPWRFTRVGPETRLKLAELGVYLKEQKKSLTPEDRVGIRAKLLDPPELLVVSQVLSPDPLRLREDFAAVACAIQNLALSLHGRGIGSKWSTGAVTRDPQTYEILGVDPRIEEVVGFVWIGYAASVPATERVAFRESYRELP